MTENTTPRQAALWFASQGHQVFPLHSVTDDGSCTCGDPACENAGKHPYAPFAPNGFFIGIGGDPVMVRDLMLGFNRGMCEPPVSDKDIVNMVTNIAEREIAKHTWIKDAAE